MYKMALHLSYFNKSKGKQSKDSLTNALFIKSELQE